MNPLDWLKALYETFGAHHPRSSMVVVMFLGAICFAGVWALAGKQYEKGLIKAPEAVTPAPINSTTGDQAPAISGHDNKVTYGESEQKKNPPKKKD